ncbi:MAG: DUF433 domain-containing protein [Desulfobacteraceae bacterium]|nr:MAG: DUF433 domain-containing protein [Desulfobacteraceae bacterium]
MPSVQKSIRVPEETVRAVEEMAAQSGKDFSALVKELLIEALKARKCPGIIYVDGPSGRRARIAGSGIEVWEFMANFKAMNEDYAKIKQAYHWLNEQQIRAAFTYYTFYPDDIEEHIRSNAGQTKNAVLKRCPFLAKPEVKP